MPEIHGPSLDCPDLCVDLPSHLGPSLGLCPLFLREPPVGGVQRREPRSALLCPGAGARLRGACSVLLGAWLAAGKACLFAFGPRTLCLASFGRSVFLGR